MSPRRRTFYNANAKKFLNQNPKNTNKTRNTKTAITDGFSKLTWMKLLETLTAMMVKKCAPFSLRVFRIGQGKVRFLSWPKRGLYVLIFKSILEKHSDFKGSLWLWKRYSSWTVYPLNPLSPQFSYPNLLRSSFGCSNSVTEGSLKRSSTSWHWPRLGPSAAFEKLGTRSIQLNVGEVVSTA